MTSPPSCPDPRTLEQRARGFCSEEDAIGLAEHATQCDRCLNLLRNLHLDDSLIEALRKSSSDSDVRYGALLTLLVQRLEQLRDRGNPELSSDNDGSESTVALPEHSPAPSEESLSFLAPAQVAGELGRLGGYRILKVLGTGGMGLVFQAEDIRLKRLVALKVMRPKMAANGEMVQRFLREAQSTAALKHDNVVTIYQVEEGPGVPFLAMEFLEGESLEQRLRRDGPLPLGDVLRIGREAANGLEAAHQRGLIHRDIKPANLWLEGKRGRVKLLDFGLARPVSTDTPLTHHGTMVGTPSYMSPEQVEAQPLDHRTDLFSLGTVLYRISTGRLPFNAKDKVGVLLAVRTANPSPPRQLKPSLPESLEKLILKMLSKKPAERPATAAAVASALRTIEKEQGLVGPKSSVVLASSKARRARASTAEQSTPPPTPPQMPSFRWVWITIATLLLLLILLGAIAGLVVPLLRNPP